MSMIVRYWKTNLILAATIVILVGFVDSGSMYTPVSMGAVNSLPKHYMYQMHSAIMDQHGTVKNVLRVGYMAHYLNNDVTAFVDSTLEIFFAAMPSVIVTSDRSWLTPEKQEIFLQGNVHLVQLNDEGVFAWEMVTDEARLLTDSNYLETGAEVTISNAEMRTKATGMQAYLDTSRLKLLSHVQTQILP